VPQLADGCTSLRLFLIRHADAEAGEPDELRRLSPAGREQARALGEQLAAQGIHADAILTSPLLRARETGEALADALHSTSEPSDALAPGATAAAVRSAVEGRGETVIVVGHQPDCGQIAAEFGDGTEPRFPPAGMVELQLPSPSTS
jgi:phosphohistidine phosphatase